MRTGIRCVWHPKRIVLALRICLTHIWLYILLPWNLCRIRFLLSTRRCCRVSRSDMSWRMTPVPVKRL